MGDNQIPDETFSMPWETPASIYHATWGYRSWQVREDLPGKVREKKIRSLVRVAARGGNYLLNIGPRGDGSIVEFEADVLKGVGAWLKRNGEAVFTAGPAGKRRPPRLGRDHPRTAPSFTCTSSRCPRTACSSCPASPVASTSVYPLDDPASPPRPLSHHQRHPAHHPSRWNCPTPTPRSTSSRPKARRLHSRARGRARH
jgi:hypothetical protein